jgi:hypothetical protein
MPEMVAPGGTSGRIDDILARREMETRRRSLRLADYPTYKPREGFPRVHLHQA